MRDPTPRDRVAGRRSHALVAVGALLVVGSSCEIRNPGTQAELLQTVNEIGDAVNALRQDTGAMQDQIDSLRVVVARQDSLITRLSTAAGVPR